MFCVNCGGEIPAGSKFCGTCGAPVAPRDEFVPEATFETTDANAPVFDDFEPDYGFGSAPVTPAKKKSKLPLIIGAVVLVLVLAVALFACGGDDGSVPEAPSAGGFFGNDSGIIVGNWDGVMLYLDDEPKSLEGLGEVSFTAKSNGSCTLHIGAFGDPINMQYEYNEALTEQLSADGDDTLMYDVTLSGTTFFYAMITDGMLGLISTDNFSADTEYMFVFEK